MCPTAAEYAVRESKASTSPHALLQAHQAHEPVDKTRLNAHAVFAQALQALFRFEAESGDFKLDLTATTSRTCRCLSSTDAGREARVTQKSLLSQTVACRDPAHLAIARQSSREARAQLLVATSAFKAIQTKQSPLLSALRDT